MSSTVGAVTRFVVCGDACGSGRLGMDAKTRMRSGMYSVFTEAFEAIGVAPVHRHQEDRGDGILVALDPGVPPTLMVGRWIETLHQGLRAWNAGSAQRLRIRVGMNEGPVLDDGQGLVGRAVDLACRLCDSGPAKQIMAAATGSDLLVVVSERLYADVVTEGGRYVEPECYRAAQVTDKETDERGWFYIPRLAQPPMEGLSGPGADAGSGAGKGRVAVQGPATGDGGGSGVGGGPVDGGGPSSPPPVPPAVPRTQIHVAGDAVQVSDSTFHGPFTGIRKHQLREGRQPPRADEGGER